MTDKQEQDTATITLLEAVKEVFAVQELRDIACKGSDAPAEHALGLLLEVVFPGEVWIDVDGHKYRKFIRFPEEVDDDTLRCIACGQIDEEEYHDDNLCRGCSPPSQMNTVE